MSLEIFWGSGSGPAWRVLLALAIKGVPYDSRLLSFSKNEHRTPELLAISPRGKVPILRDGDFAVSESLAILTYLDRKHPTPPLFGTTPEDAGTIMRVIMDHEIYADRAIQAVTRPLFVGKLDEQRDQVTAALPGLRDELARLTKQLGARSFLVGDTISAADIFVFPMFKTIERAIGKPAAETLDHGLRPLGAAFPELAAWAARIEALPGYDATFPPHWREG